MPTVAEIASWVEHEYPPALAESWDAVGLVCGQPEAPVSRILVTVDVTRAVVSEALAAGADFILAHHPLLLTPVHGVAATDANGRLIHQLIEGGCALMTAHTNADAGRGGVSDALAAALGLVEVRPLDRSPREPLDKIVVFVPAAAVSDVVDALAAAGAGSIGNYDRCAHVVEGKGTFRPLSGADPHIGAIGEVEAVSEHRVEMVAPRSRREAVVTALRAAHPYEEPAFDVVEMAQLASDLGIGRIGRLPRPTLLATFAEQVAAVLPATAQGVRVAGDLDGKVEIVAVCGGSGDSYLHLADARGADVYLTSDLKHHRVSDHRQADRCAVIDVAHYASEFPWCGRVADALTASFNEPGDTVSVTTSRVVTDPWDWQVRSSP